VRRVELLVILYVSDTQYTVKTKVYDVIISGTVQL